MSLRYSRVYIDSPELTQDADGTYTLRAYTTYSIAAGSSARIDTGLTIDVPPGHIAYIVSLHDWLGFQHLTLEGEQIILSDDAIAVKVYRAGNAPFPTEILAGDMIAQFVVVPIFSDNVEEVFETKRG